MAEDSNNNNKKKKPIKWAKSDAKFLLREDVIGGIVTAEMKPKEVYDMRDCYADYKYENFRANLRSLRLAVKEGLSRAEADEEAYLDDKALYGKTADGAWHRSVAYTLLKDDMRTGKVDGKKPKEVYDSRKEYKTFTLKKSETKFITSMKGEQN